MEELDQYVRSHTGRWVVAILALATPVLTAFCAWLQDAIGIDLDPAALTAFVGAVGAGIVLTGWQWLRSRGQFERLVTEILHLHDMGEVQDVDALVEAKEQARAEDS